MKFRITKNLLHYYVDLLRGKNQQETGTALHNIIRSMRINRDSKVCGEDFSRLDFQNVQLNGIDFSMNGAFPSNFNESIIEKQSIYSGHYGGIFFAQFSDDESNIITWGFDGQIVIWDIATQSIQNILTAYDSIDPDFDWYLIKGYPFYRLDILPFHFNIAEITKKYLNKYITLKSISGIPQKSKANLSIRKWLRYKDIYGGRLCYITDDSKFAIISYNNGGPQYRVIDYSNLSFISDCYQYIGISQKGQMYFGIDYSWNLKLFSISNNNLMMEIVPHKKEIASSGISVDNIHCYSLCRNLSSDISSSLIEWNIENGRIERRILCDSKEKTADSEIKDILRSYSKRANVEYFGFEDDNWERYDGIILKSSDHSFEIACVGYENLDYDRFYFNDYKSSNPMCIEEYIKAIALNPDESFFIYVTSRLEIVYWEIASQTEQKRILTRTTEDAYTTSVELSLDGSLLIICYSNGVINVIRSATGEPIKRFEHFSQLYVDGCSFRHAQMDEALRCLLQSYGGIF